MSDNDRRHSPAAERNRQAILAALESRLPPAGLALEVASGSGQHAAFFAEALPGWQWQPSDGDDSSRASIDAWCQGLANVRPAVHLDVQGANWPGVPEAVDAVFCANLLHIAPWPACAGLMRGAARHLPVDAKLFVYGPFVVDGQVTASSNLAFDADLRQRNPQWGLRRLSDVQAQAAQAGLQLQEQLNLPANNLLLVFTRS